MDDEEIDNIRSSLSNILNLLGWTEESLLTEEAKVQCPLNENHLIPESSLKSHIERCKWFKDGYTKEEMEKALPSSSFSYADGVSISLDKELLSKITSGARVNNSGFRGYASGISKPPRNVPKTMDRFTVEFSPQERLAVYDYAVSKTKEARKSSEVQVEDLLFDFEKKDDKDKPKSHLEILAEKRDYKRRRPTYRAKNVHITKKSHTEVMREVIENQMSYLTEIQKQSKSYSDSKRLENMYHDDKKEKHEESSDDRESDDRESENTDHSGYKSDRYSGKLHESSHRKRKRSRTRSWSRDRHRHSSSHKHKSSRHNRDRKHHKH